VHIKKRGLCEVHYQRERKNAGGFPPQGEMVGAVHRDMFSLRRHKRSLYPREMEFVRHFFEHKNWFYELVTFHCEDFNYTPDFYDANRNVFIEVIGTRQALHKNREKYQKIIEMLPHLKFEFRLASGDMIDIYADRRYTKEKKIIEFA